MRASPTRQSDSQKREGTNQLEAAVRRHATHGLVQCGFRHTTEPVESPMTPTGIFERPPAEPKAGRSRAAQKPLGPAGELQDSVSAPSRSIFIEEVSVDKPWAPAGAASPHLNLYADANRLKTSFERSLQISRAYGASSMPGLPKTPLQRWLPLVGTIPGTVNLCESPAETEGFPTG